MTYALHCSHDHNSTESAILATTRIVHAFLQSSTLESWWNCCVDVFSMMVHGRKCASSCRPSRILSKIAAMEQMNPTRNIARVVTGREEKRGAHVRNESLGEWSRTRRTQPSSSAVAPISLNNAETTETNTATANHPTSLHVITDGFVASGTDSSLAALAYASKASIMNEHATTSARPTNPATASVWTGAPQTSSRWMRLV